MTDPQLFTGAHKHRFDPKTGRGKGLSGRDSVRKGAGHSAKPPPGTDAVYDLSEILRGPDFCGSPTGIPEAIPPSSSTTETSTGIFSRLTDHRIYTGSHRHRFDKSGHGRGRDGRDAGPQLLESPGMER